MSVRKTITAKPSDPVLSVIEKLKKFRITRIVIATQQNTPVCIITEKDLVRALYRPDSKLLPSIKAQDIMSTDLVTVLKRSTIENGVKIMVEHGISSVIVTENDGKLAGIITKSDLVHELLIHVPTSALVSRIMTKRPVTVNPNDVLYLVESILINNNISKVIVAEN